MKRKTTKQLKKEALRLFSIYTRLKDCLRTTGTTTSGRCISCGKIFPFKELQAGHFVSGRHNSNLFNERGCHAQCRGCNLFKHGNQLEYRRAIIKLYGEGVDEEIEAEDKIVKDLRAGELRELITHYKQEIEKLREGK